MRPARSPRARASPRSIIQAAISRKCRRVTCSATSPIRTAAASSSRAGRRALPSQGAAAAGLFVLNPSIGAFELRGALVGGNSSCGFQQGIDQFSRFDVTFPLVQQYLAPDASNPARIAPVVEFFNAAKNDYLITADPVEISALDSGSPQGWVRTGLRFLAYTDPSVAPAGRPAGVSVLCAPGAR